MKNHQSETLLLEGVNLYLIGMMGAGKSTIGQLLAPQLQYTFFDTDELIVKLAGRSVSEIFAQEGEEIFRQLETQVLAEICSYKKLVISTGGGIILNRKNWSYLHHGIIVWLDVPVTELYHRLQTDKTRPLLQESDPLETLKRILRQRESLYAQADVHLRIIPGETPEHIAHRLLLEVKKVLKKHDDSGSPFPLKS